LVEKLQGENERERPLGKSRHRWVDNVRMNLNVTGWEAVG
jgi:hypothetical protein